MGAIWAILNSPIGIAAVASAVSWVLGKLSVEDRHRTRLRQVLAVAAIVARHAPKGEEWADFMVRLLDEMSRRGMKEPTGPEVNAIHGAWNAMGATGPTPPIVARLVQNGTRVPKRKGDQSDQE